MFLFLFLFACTPLTGEWTGEVDCGEYAMDVSIEIEWTGAEYEGDGKLDCTDYAGSDCEQTFDIQIEPEGPVGEQELDVDLDDCHADVGGFESDVGCDNPDDVDWDGGDTITGEWAQCEFELERE